MLNLFWSKKVRVVSFLSVFLLIFILLAFGTKSYAYRNFFKNQKVDDEIIILYTSNELGVIDNFDKIAWQKEELEKKYENVFLLSAGNTFSGSTIVDNYWKDNVDLRGKPIVELMNFVGYQVLNLGVDDFEYGQQTLQNNINRANFQIISANLEVSNNSKLDYLQPYTTFETSNGDKILFLGFMEVLKEDKQKVNSDNFLELNFSDMTKVVESYSYLSEESDITIALTNINDKNKLLNEVSWFDIIIGGEQQDKLKKTNYLAKLKIKLKNGQPSEIKEELIDISSIPGSSEEVKTKINDYYAELDKISEDTIVELTEVIQEDMVGNLIADAVKEELNLDIALQNSGAIRKKQLGLEVRMRDIYQTLPFAEQVLILRITGERLVELFGESYNKNEDIKFYMAGAKSEIILDGNTALKEIKLKDSKGKFLSKDNKYRVGINNYLAAIHNLDDEAIIEESISKKNVSDIVIDYLRNNEELDLTDLDEVRKQIQFEVSEEQEHPLVISEAIISTIGKNKESVTAGNLIADSFAEMTEADVGIYNSQTLKDNIVLQPGIVTEEILNFIYSSFAYNNNIITANLTGEELKYILLRKIEENSGQVAAQISSDLSYNILKQGEKTKEIDVYYKGEKINLEENYKIAINDFEFSNYINELEGRLDSKVLDVTERDILFDYLAEIKKIDTDLERKRIFIKRE